MQNQHHDWQMWLECFSLTVLPYIMYCAEVWGNIYATNIQCLVLLQKKGSKVTLWC